MQRDFHFVQTERDSPGLVFAQDAQPIPINDGSLQREFSNAVAQIQIPPGASEQADLDAQLDKVLNAQGVANADLEERLVVAIDDSERFHFRLQLPIGSRRFEILQKLRAARDVREALDQIAVAKEIQLKRDFAAELLKGVAQINAQISKLKGQ